MIKVKASNIVVNESYFSNNLLAPGNFSLKPELSRSISKNNENGLFAVELKLSIKNTPENPFPIDVLIRLSGIFDFSEGTEEEIIEYLNHQGTDLVYPYMRAYVANLTALSMIPAIQLPQLTAFESFKNDKN